MRLQGYQVLSDHEMTQIHAASLRLLERTGTNVLSEPALELLADGGAEVNFETRRVHFPKSLVEDALASLPSSFYVYDRTGNTALDIGDSRLYFVGGMDANYIYDPSTGTRRSATKQDIADFARLADALPNIHIVSPQAIPHDVPGDSALVHAFEAVANNTTKPIYITPGGKIACQTVLNMAQQVIGDIDLGKHSFLIGYAAPTSPLTWQPDAAEALIEIVSRGIPFSIGPAPLMGMISPMTPAGAVVQANAEQLSGIVMAYLVRPGTPVLYGVMPITADMRFGTPAHGDPNTALARLAGANMARFYNLPGIVSGPNSDAHCLDEQNAWEKMLTMAVAMNAGVNIMVNAGAFATVSTVSYEQLVLDDEMAAICQQLLRGVEVSAETLALDLIEGVGPGGNFLAQKHTLKHWRNDYWLPQVSNRVSFSAWSKAGNKDVVTVAAERAKKLLAEHQPAPLPQSTKTSLRRICREFEDRQRLEK